MLVSTPKGGKINFWKVFAQIIEDNNHEYICYYKTS